jgi:hypothetical protein
MIKYLLFSHIHIIYYLALFLPLIVMGDLKFSQTHLKPYYTNLMVSSLKKKKGKQLDIQ